MFLIVDLVILGILALCIFVGYKRGLTKCLINILSFFIAIAVAFVLFKPTSAIITASTQVDENIQNSIVSIFEAEENNNSDKTKEEEEKSSPILKYISDEVKDATAEKKAEIVNNTAKEISLRIVDILAFIGLFILTRIILIFVKALADLITKLPVIKQCDKLGGVLYGIIQALVIIFVALAVITFVSTITNDYRLLEMINQSFIGSILNNYNILLKVVF